MESSLANAGEKRLEEKRAGWTGLIANLLQQQCGAAIDTATKYSME
jgi:hypothetical protein